MGKKFLKNIRIEIIYIKNENNKPKFWDYKKPNFLSYLIYHLHSNNYK